MALSLGATLAFLSLFVVLARLRRGIAGTSLASAWWTLVVGWIAWGATWLASQAGWLSPVKLDLAWYFVAVIMLLPPIAVLGARRPIHRAWPWFVLAPLVLVFSWPLISACARGVPAGWNVEEPIAVGYVLVLVMGAGNYLGLRASVPALLWMGALILVVGPLCPTTARWLIGAADGRLWATLLLAAAGWLADCLSRRRPASQGVASLLALDRVWTDFRELFGIVWSRRVQERFNEQASRQGLEVRIGIAGFEASSQNAATPGIPDEALAARAETMLRWFLQKFVDDSWIDTRIGNGGRDSPPLAGARTHEV